MNKLLKIKFCIAGLCIFAGLLLLISCAAMPTKESANVARLSVTGSGLTGTAMNIEGSAFRSGEVVELELNMDGLVMQIGNASGKPIVASEKGTFKIESGYPAKQIFVPGTWDLQATGDKGSTAQAKVIMKVQ